jgi:hypothetical protein
MRTDRTLSYRLHSDVKIKNTMMLELDYLVCNLATGTLEEVPSVRRLLNDYVL